jgi:hypothetical protein
MEGMKYPKEQEYEMELDLVTVTRHRLLASQEIRQQIEQRAYEFYLERGCQPGNAEQDWLRAEEEVLGPLIRQEMNISWESETNSPGLAAETEMAPSRINKVTNQGKEKKKASKSAKLPAVAGKESQAGTKTTSKSRLNARSSGKSVSVLPSKPVLAKEAKPKSRRVSTTTTPKSKETQI